MPEFYVIFARKNTFSPNFGGQFPALKLRVSGLDPNTNYMIMVDIVLRAQSCKIPVYAPPYDGYVTLQN